MDGNSFLFTLMARATSSRRAWSRLADPNNGMSRA
jgi:hypothetical protein